MESNKQIISGINLEAIGGLLQGEQRFIELDDEKKTVEIGRAKDNNFVLHKDDISAGRKHVCITIENGMCMVEDLESKNGTWVNEKRITQKTPIKSGDVLVLGYHTYIKVTLKIKEVAEKLPDSISADRLLQLMAQMEQLQDKYGARVLANLYQFVLEIERFIIALTIGVEDTVAMTLPSHPKHLKQLMTQLLEKNDPEAEKDIEGYLKDLKYWYMAVVAGYEKAEAKWFDNLWEKISPQTIERSMGRKKTLSSSPEWIQYKNTVRDLNSNLIQDEVKEMAIKLAKEMFNDLKKKEEGV